MTVILLLLHFSSKAEDPNESSWTDLKDEPSRQQLFENIKRASLGGRRALPVKFLFPNDVLSDSIRNVARDKVLFGVDVSHHDYDDHGKLPITKLLDQKVDFVYAKATQGINYKDPKFPEYWDELGKLQAGQRPLRGAFHFLDALDDAKQQAKRFVEYVNLHGEIRANDMPPCLDLEWDKRRLGDPDRWTNQSADEILAKTLAWLQETKALTGRTPLVYTSAQWWRERHIPNEKIGLLKDYPIWIADYSKSGKASEKPAVIDG